MSPTPSTCSDGSEILELTDQDLMEQATVRYGDRYDLLSLVGAGAYGSVYRARDSELDEVVAVKVLRREHIAQPRALERFRREVRLARRVAHPNVARTFDIGKHEGERFLTMEFIDGQPLTRFGSIGTPVKDLLPIRLVIDVAIQLCAGLGALHAAGIVHRDLKPDNVLVGRDGRVVITDFGIARALECSDAEKTAVAQLTGTPAYMSPEQARGSGNVDIRADLYSLGIIIFQLLTGQLPFMATSAIEMALSRLYQPPADPRKLREQLPVELGKLLLRSLELEPDQRFQTADELSTALSNLRPPGGDLADYLSARPEIMVRQPVNEGDCPPPHTLDSPSEIAAALALKAQLLAEPAPASLPALAPLQDPIQSAVASLPPAFSSIPDARTLGVAVLLFRLHGEPADDYLAHGLTEEIIDRLSESEGLRVTSFGAVRRLGVEARDASAVGKELHAQVVLDGSLRVLSASLSAIVRMIDVDSGLQFAVRRFERADRNVLALAGEISQVIGGLLTVKLDQSQVGLISDAVAVDLYVRARQQYNRVDQEGARRCVDLFEQALHRLPDEPTLLTGYAEALARQWFFAGQGAAEHAREAAERAVQAAPGRGEPYLALAHVQVNEAKLPEAAVSLCRALARAPRLAEAHELLGHLLSETGPLDGAIRQLSYAMMLDRSVPRVRFTLARAYFMDGQLEPAVSLLRADSTEAEFAPIMWSARVRLLSWQQDSDAAQALLHESAATLAAPEHAETLARLEFLAGVRHISAEEYVPAGMRARAASPRAWLFGSQLLIEYYLLSGQRAEALAELRKIVEQGFADLLWIDLCPLLAPLRDSSDFAALRTPVAERARRVQRAFGLPTA